jgi:hypothetical protein
VVAFPINRPRVDCYYKVGSLALPRKIRLSFLGDPTVNGRALEPLATLHLTQSLTFHHRSARNYCQPHLSTVSLRFCPKYPTATKPRVGDQTIVIILAPSTQTPPKGSYPLPCIAGCTRNVRSYPPQHSHTTPLGPSPSTPKLTLFTDPTRHTNSPQTQNNFILSTTAPLGVMLAPRLGSLTQLRHQ